MNVHRVDKPWLRAALIALLWTALVCGSLAWNLRQGREQAIHQAESEAKANLQRDLAIRRWASRHGGIYVPVTEQNPPNPFLANIANRDVALPDGKTLTLMNPAAMLREMKQEQERLYGVLARITGEKYLNPANAPDAWEKKALRLIADTLADYSELSEIDGKPYLRMMQPMIMDESCMKCHAWTGIRVGELRGATDVAIPVEPYLALWRRGASTLAMTHGGIWLLGMGLIALMTQASRRHGEANRNHQLALADQVTRLEAEVAARAEAETQLRRSHDELSERSAEIATINTTLREEIAVREQAQRALEAGNIRQQALIVKLEDTRNQLLQSEKMASIGQLAAGLAHEINNPTGFVQANLDTLSQHARDLLAMIDAYERTETALPAPLAAEIAATRARLDLAWLREDMPGLIRESMDGLDRVKRIVEDMKDFSHVGEAEWQPADLEKGLDSTLNVVWNELKRKCQVVREYAGIRKVDCLASQINQVFLNLLVNAAQAIEDKGTITLRTGQTDDAVWVEVEDTGQGIPAENLTHVFEPFFTTKPVGQGTGLGLSVSWNIVQRHGGRIEVDSAVGRGTRFRVWLPFDRAPVAAPSGATG